MPDLKIDKEFAELLPPLTSEERLKLEESIQKYGCKDSIVVWKEQNTIIDGHNRYEICNRLGIDFKQTLLSFNSHDAAKLWMLKNQMSRRNLNAFHRTRAQLLIANLEKDLAPEDDRLVMLPDGGGPRQKVTPAKEKQNTVEKVAEKAGVSPDTVRKVSYLEDHVDEKTRDKLMKGETSITREYKVLKEKEQKPAPEVPEEFAPRVAKLDVVSFLEERESAGDRYDLLLTEPPSFEEFKKNGDLNKYIEFQRTWLQKAMQLMNPEARMFLFADTDVFVLQRLLSLAVEVSNKDMEFKDLLIWTFKPPAKEPANHDFRQNWQGIIFFRGRLAQIGDKSKDLNTVLHFIKDMNNDYKYKQWRKPVHLLRKLVQLSVRPGQKMLDPFAGSGHFLVTAARAHALAHGCDNNSEMHSLSIENGCRRFELP